NFAIILSTTVIGIALGIAYIVKVPSIYTANAQIMIDTRRVQVFQQRPILDDYLRDSAALENDFQIIQSKDFALSIVKKLNLANDPTFIEQSKGVMSFLLGLLPNLSPSIAPGKELDHSAQAAAAIQDNLKVTRVGGSLVIDISFRSRSPERAAQIANAI